jgi:transcriptional regulator with XRE-family HTH domain
MNAADRFGARCRELREARGWTQRQLAGAAQACLDAATSARPKERGVTARAVAQWEQGIREPSWRNVVAVAEALGVPVGAFLEEPAASEKREAGRPAKRKPAAPDSGPPGKAKGKRAKRRRADG